MKKLFLTGVLCLFSMLLFAKDSLLRTREEYLIAVIHQHALANGVYVKIDNGNQVEYVKNESGQKLLLSTTAAALNYIAGRGWGFLQHKKWMPYHQRSPLYCSAKESITAV